MPDSLPDLRSEPVADLHAVVHAGPVLRDRGPFARALRSLAFRFMRPFIAYQQQVNVANVEAIEALQDRMAAYQLDLATVLAEERRRERVGPGSPPSGDSPDELATT